jgi:hypothetical protein
MRKIDVRDLEEDTELEIVFGSYEEHITYEKVDDPEEFCIVVENTAYGRRVAPLYLKDIPNLIKALQKLQEMVE